MTNTNQPQPTITCATAVNKGMLDLACRDTASVAVAVHPADLHKNDLITGTIVCASSSEATLKDRVVVNALVWSNEVGSKWRTVTLHNNAALHGEYALDLVVARFPINECDDALEAATVTRVQATPVADEAFKVRRVIAKLTDAINSADSSRAAFAAKVAESGAAYAIRWNANGTVADEAQGDLAAHWLGALADTANADRPALDVVARCMAVAADRLLFNSADDTWSGRFSNDVVRSADDAVRALLRDLKWYVPFGTVLAAG